MSEGIIIKVEQGDRKLEIKIGKDVNPEQLKVIQKVLEKFAESATPKNSSSVKQEEVSSRSSPSRFFKVKTIIASYFSNGQWFTSLDLRELYEEFYKESLPPNTASTYLRRLEKQGVLNGRKRGKMVEYVVVNPDALEVEVGGDGIKELEVENK